MAWVLPVPALAGPAWRGCETDGRDVEGPHGSSPSRWKRSGSKISTASCSTCRTALDGGERRRAAGPIVGTEDPGQVIVLPLAGKGRSPRRGAEPPSHASPRRRGPAPDPDYLRIAAAKARLLLQKREKSGSRCPTKNQRTRVSRCRSASTAPQVKRTKASPSWSASARPTMTVWLASLAGATQGAGEVPYPHREEVLGAHARELLAHQTDREAIGDGAGEAGPALEQAIDGRAARARRSRSAEPPRQRCGPLRVRFRRGGRDRGSPPEGRRGARGRAISSARAPPTPPRARSRESAPKR